jgi:hypothetical protein
MVNMIIFVWRLQYRILDRLNRGMVNRDPGLMVKKLVAAIAQRGFALLNCKRYLLAKAMGPMSRELTRCC